MTLSQEQILQLMSDGGSVVGDDGELIEIEKEAAPDTGNKALLSVILSLTQQNTQLTAQMAARPKETAAAPVPIPSPQAAFWDCQVTERDREGRIARVQFRGK